MHLLTVRYLLIEFDNNNIFEKFEIWRGDKLKVG